jgi:hypothetical protein
MNKKRQFQITKMDWSYFGAGISFIPFTLAWASLIIADPIIISYAIGPLFGSTVGWVLMNMFSFRSSPWRQANYGLIDHIRTDLPWRRWTIYIGFVFCTMSCIFGIMNGFKTEIPPDKIPLLLVLQPICIFFASGLYLTSTNPKILYQ